MIDMHLHTLYSDGTNSLSELLKICEEKKLEYISITDHDNCKAYFELEDLTHNFTGKIVNGIEITTHFNKYRIELLAYGFNDYQKVHEYFDKIHELDWDLIYKETRLHLLSKIDKLNLKYDVSIKKNILVNRFESKLYQSLLKNNSNLREILKNEYCERASLFFRKCISNPESQFFINYSKYYYSIDEVMDFIKKEGGKLFLAHPYSYGFDDVISYITDLYDRYDIDGIEVYHSYCSKDNTEDLKQFALDRDLLICGGSDYHGLNRPELSVGYLYKSKLTIPSEIILDWVK